MSPDDLNKFLSYFLSGLSYSFAILFFYIAVFKSPPSIYVYRNTMLNLAIWYMIAMGSYAILFQPVYTALPNKSCVRIVGLVSHFGRELHVAVMYLTVLSIENVFVAITICFFYRYDQLRSTNWPNFRTTCRGIPIYVSMHIAVSILACSLTYIFLLVGELIELKGTFLFCTDIDNYSMVKLLAIVVAVLLITQFLPSTALAFMTILRLRSQKASMSRWTIQVQHLLTINLVVLLVLPIVFDVIPICTLCYMIYIKAESLYFWVSLISHTPFADVVLSFAATLYFVTPYRRVVSRMLCTSSVDVSSSLF